MMGELVWKGMVNFLHGMSRCNARFITEKWYGWQNDIYLVTMTYKVFFSNLLHKTFHSDTLKKYSITIVYYNIDTCDMHTTHRAEPNNRVLPFSSTGKGGIQWERS